MKGQAKENVKLLRSYHDRLIGTYQECIKSANKRRAETDKGVTDDTDMSVMQYLQYPSGFDILLWETVNDREKREARLSRMGNSTGDPVDFGFLLVSLSRIVPFVDKIVKRICDMNIGDSVITGENRIQAMRSAFVWLHLQATDSRELLYQDMARLTRFVRFQILRYKQNYRLPVTPDSIRIRYERLNDEVWGATSDAEKRAWLERFRACEKTLLHKTFSVFEDLHAYYDYMKQVDDQEFLDSFGDRSEDKTDQFERIYLMAVNVQNIILRRFASFVKISDLNLPHGNYGFADFKSSTLSESNFTSADFHFTDFSDAVVRSSDISVSDLTFCYAVNADFTNTNLNSTNLVGADFTNATLSKTQFLNALFRDPKMDFSNNRQDNAYNGEGFCAQCSVGSLRSDFFAKLGRSALKDQDGGSRTPSLWEYTSVAENDRRIYFLGALKNANDILQEQWKMVDAACRRKVVTPEELGAMQKKLNSTGVDASTTEIPLTAVFNDTTMNEAQLPHADLSHVNMRTCSLNQADVNDADLYYTNMEGAAMIGANFSNARFYRAKLNSTNFQESNLIGASMICANLKSANFSRAIMIDAFIMNERSPEMEGGEIFLDYILENDHTVSIAKAKDQTLESTCDVSLMDCNFNYVVGTEMVICGMNADRSTWLKAELKKARFFNTILRWGRFAGADLSYSILIGVSMQQASADDVTMPNSRLYACDMTGIKLRNTNMIGSLLERVLFRNADMSGVNLSRAFVRNCVISDVNLNGANLSDTVFENVIFDDVDLTSCIGLSTARFHHCFFGYGCMGLHYQKGADGKADVNFMSIHHHGSRVKFFLDPEPKKEEVSGAEEAEEWSFGNRWYTSLSYDMIF